MKTPLHDMLADLTRERTPERINELVNHPDCAGFNSFKGPGIEADLSPFIGSDTVFCLMAGYGGVLYQRLMPGTYEAHTNVLKRGRGEWCLLMVQATLHWMFTKTDAIEVVTKVLKGNLPARALAQRCGLKYNFTDRRAGNYMGTSATADVSALPIQNWLPDAPGLRERGEWLRDKLGGECARLGGTLDLPQDPDWDRHAGAAYEMILGGQMEKAQAVYNRFALMTGYQPMPIIAHSPKAVTLEGLTIIVRRDGEFHVSSISGDRGLRQCL